MDKPVAAAPTGAKEKVEKQARQLAYDVRYKTKQSLAQKSGGKVDPAAVSKMYMSQLAKSPAPPAIKAKLQEHRTVELTGTSVDITEGTIGS